MTRIVSHWKENNDIRIILVSVIYFLSAYLGLLLAFKDPYTSPVWPPVGVGFALIILLGPRSWPGITIGSLVSYMLVFWLNNIRSGTGSILASALIAFGNTLEILVGFYLVEKFIKNRDPFLKAIHTFMFLVISMAMCVIGSSIGTYSLYINDIISENTILQKWFFWWIPNVASVLLFTPFILSWKHGFGFNLSRNHLFEMLIFMVIISSFVLLWQFDKLSVTIEKSMPFLVIPFLLWLAFRFNLQTAMTGILVTALTAIYLTINGIGPFVLDTNENSIIILQIFIGVISITALVLSSTVHETKSAQATIKKFNETLEARIQERTNELNEQVATRRKAEHKLLVSNRSLRKANKELDNFVYRVSHDLRAPIASVLGLVNLARNESKPEILLQYFEMVGKSAGQQDLFIKDILDISRNARLEVDRKKIYFRKLIEDTLDQLKYYDKNKKPETNIHITGKANFYSDPSRLKVIFNNLISNSIRYSNGRDPIIDINIYVDDSFANISIRDNGIGIEKKHQKKVFDMFYRATDDNAGSGLGLYIVKESIDKLSGSVELDSEVGTGTMVTLKVPNLLNAHPEESVEEEI